VVVLGFLLCEDEDLPKVEFRKALLVNVIVHLLLGVCWIGWYSVMCTHDFILTVCF
jgi:hypothetical protein